MLWLLASCRQSPPDSEPKATFAIEPMQRFEATDLFTIPPDELPNEQGPGVALGDFDGDHDIDAILVIGADRADKTKNDPSRSFVFGNDGTGHLTIDDGFTLDGAPFPTAISVTTGDLDDDGDLDLVLTREVGMSDLVAMNDGSGRFTSQPLPNSLGEHLSPVLADFNGDGVLDLFVAGFEHDMDLDEVQTGTVQGDGSMLYLGSGEGAFVEQTGAIDPRQQWALTYQGTPFDPDDDGDLDLFLANDWGQYVTPMGLLENDGSGQFLEVPSQICFCNTPITAMGAVAGDIDEDGDADLYITNWGPNLVLLNEGNLRFLEAAQSLSVNPDNIEESVVTWGAALTDLDLDGHEDLVMVNGPVLEGGSSTEPDDQPDVLLLGRGGGNFEDVGDQLGFDDRGVGRSLALGDLDGDGVRDVVVATRTGLLTYRVTTPNPGVLLSLAGPPGNPHGIGARIVAETTKGPRTFWMGNHPTFSASTNEVAIGGAPTSLTVHWPSHDTTVVDEVPAGRLTLRLDGETETR